MSFQGLSARTLTVQLLSSYIHFMMKHCLAQGSVSPRGSNALLFAADGQKCFVLVDFFLHRGRGGIQRLCLQGSRGSPSIFLFRPEGPGGVQVLGGGGGGRSRPITLSERMIWEALVMGDGVERQQQRDNTFKELGMILYLHCVWFLMVLFRNIEAPGRGRSCS